MGPVTNTSGAMHGRGKLTWALIVESPAALALKSPVLMLVMRHDSPHAVGRAGTACPPWVT